VSVCAAEHLVQGQRGEHEHGQQPRRDVARDDGQPADPQGGDDGGAGRDDLAGGRERPYQRGAALDRAQLGVQCIDPCQRRDVGVERDEVDRRQ